MTSAPPENLPGVDLAALARWMDEHTAVERAGELSGQVIAGGKSNLTYRITDGQSVWALRRPPLAHVLPTAHDMAREYRVIAALASTDVAVPLALALCSDPEVLGAPFYLMSFVDGLVLDDAEEIDRLDPATAGAICRQLIDTLATLHDLDPAAVGLGDFGRPEGFLARQLKRWHTQWVASETAHRPDLEPLVERLGTHLPEQSAPGVVHGDYRLTNVIYRRDFTAIAAVVDWEMATLGDPLTDLGLMIVYHTLSADGSFVMPPLRPSAGFYTVDQWTEAYAQRSGRDLAALDWYVAFGYFKLAVVAEGIHNRYRQGKTVGAGFDHFGPAVPGLLAAGLAQLDRS